MNWPKKRFILFCVTAVILYTGQCSGRSRWRPQDPLIPELKVRYSDCTRVYTTRDYHLEYIPLFKKYEHEFFMSHLLPSGDISYRSCPEKSVKGSTLKKLFNELLFEVAQRKEEPTGGFKHFSILKSDDFNFRLTSGLIVLKYKDYPFVLKLFIKNPETFMKLSDGLIPRFFFRMGGGINRHLSGFTRVKNLEAIRAKVEVSDFWRDFMDTPRKWFLLPDNPRWLHLEGKNIGPSGTCTTEIPAVYATVSDFIESDGTFTLMNPDERETALAFAHYLENRVDAHVDNFMFEKRTDKIVIVDTEHFPTMVGLKKPFEYDSYTEWYAKLSMKYVENNFCQSKRARRELQTSTAPYMYPV